MINLGTSTMQDFALGDNLVERIDLGDTTIFDPYTEVTGTLPLSFNSRVAGALKNYRLYGDSDGAGVQTENKFDGDWLGGVYTDANFNRYAPTSETFKSMKVYLEAGSYTVSFPKNVRLLRTIIDGVFVNDDRIVKVFTITTTENDYVGLSFQEVENVPFDITMKVTLTPGSTAPTSYIPYGYKIPILNTSGVTENLWEQNPTQSEINGVKIEILSNGIHVYSNGSTGAISAVDNFWKNNLSLPISAGNYTFKFWMEGQHTNQALGFYGPNNSSVFTSSKSEDYATFESSGVSYYYGVYVPNGWNGDMILKVMLVPGSTVPDHYIPHRYSSNYDLFIGDSKLGAEEYADYGEQKVYKLKEVHKDIVTINGIEWDILGYDHDTVYKSDNTLAQHSVTIQTHDCISELQFDAKEALFAFPEGLATGTYHFTVSQQPWYAGDVGKTMQFTLANAIPADGIIVLGNSYNATMIGSTISVYASCSATTAIETATISEGSDGTDLGSVGNAISGNTNSIQRALLGNNNYNESAIRQYLNSDGTAGTYWMPQNKWDRPPSWNASTAGFLRGFNSDFISAIGKVKKRTAKNTVLDGGGYIDTEEKVFLLSRTEVYAGANNNVDEGGPYRYFSEFSDLSSAGTGADSNRTKYRNNVAKYWWLRSPNTNGAYAPFHVSPSGAVNFSSATVSYGVAPACCIVLDDINTNPYLQSLFYKPTDPPAPLPAIQAYQGENTLSSTETVGEVTVKGRIYPMYRQVEYLKSTGTQYIDTDIIPTYLTKTELDIKFSDIVASADNDHSFFFGISGASALGVYNALLQRRTSNDVEDICVYDGFYYSAGGMSLLESLSVKTRNILTINRPTSSWGSTTVSTDKTITAVTPTVGLCIFGLKGITGGQQVFLTQTSRNMFLYECKIYLNGSTLSNDLIPVERYDGVLGLYDKIAGKFYTNVGTGEFVKGEYV